MAVCNPGAKGPILCVTAHYDSVENSPGARDNAAAVAILLELGRCLGSARPELAGEIRLLFFGSEENGYFGSRAYVEGLSEELRARHLAVFNMDISAASADVGELVCCTLGGPGPEGYQSGDHFSPAENTASKAVAKAYASLYPGGRLTTIHNGESDHVSFHQAGIEAANVCWRAVEGPFGKLPAEYHLESDVAETIDYGTALVSGQCVLQALEDLLGAS